MLFIKNLSIRNFKNIQKADFDFSKINLIEGETGEGKTAVVEALTLLFCNYLEGKIEEWINWNSDKFNISCEFNYKNIDYTYSIEANKKGNTNRLLKFKDEEYKKSDAYKYLAEHILDPHLTLYSSISEQGKTSAILFESPTKSLETLKKIFKIDVVNDKVDLIKLNIKEIDEEIKILQAEKNILESKQFDYNELPELPNIDIKKYEEKIVQLEKDKTEYNNQYLLFKIYEEKIKKYNQLQENKSNLESEIIELNKSKTSIQKRLLDEVIFNHDEYLILSNSLIELNNNLKEHKSNKKRIEDIDIKIDKVNKDIEKFEKQIEENKIVRLERCKFNQDNIKEIRQDIRDKANDLNFFNTQLQAIRSGQCPTCGNKYFEKDESQVLIDIENTTEELRKLELQERIIEESIKDYEKKLNDNKIIQNKIINIQENLNNKKVELNDLVKTKYFIKYDKDEEQSILNEINIIENKKESLDNIKSQYETIKSQNDIVRNKINEVDVLLTKKVTLLESINEVEKPVEVKISITFDEQEYEKIKKDVQDYKNIEIRRDELSKLNKAVEEQRNKNNIEIETKLEQVVIKQKKSRILSESQKILNKEFSAYLIDRKTKYINLKMDEFFQRAYNGKYRIKFEQSENKVGFYYSIDNENWHSTITLSGFERQLFSVAFRLALSSIQNPGFFIADEIDSDASTLKSISLYRNLLNEEKTTQLFCISHNDVTKEFITNIKEAKLFTIENGNLIN